MSPIDLEPAVAAIGVLLLGAMAVLAAVGPRHQRVQTIPTNDRPEENQ
ncbi:hypothetical protein [Streptomyces sp. NPDC059165]